MSDDDDSMGEMLHIPLDTGTNSSDSESATTDEGDNDDNDKESYHTNDGMGQENSPSSNNMETSENEESSSEDDWGKKVSDDSSESSTEEDLSMIVKPKGKATRKKKESGPKQVGTAKEKRHLGTQIQRMRGITTTAATVTTMRMWK